tara:strand:+ start:1120 stop:2034 length:915 start_codon:yes stop_codon:yes gene_type:complete
MSTGNENFITIDNIAEIQDIVDGDYIFTINNGVIYKLDFENFIISKENTTFSTLIDSMSAAVVSNTKSLCAINGYINKIKPSLNSIDSVVATVSALSADWTSTHTTINTLSSQAFLPISTDSNNIQAGSMVYYNGETSKFITLPSGFAGESLVVNDQGLPTFSDSGSGSRNIESGSQNVLTRNRTGSAKDLGDFEVDENVTVFTAGTDYSELQINYNINYFVTVTGSSATAGSGGQTPSFNLYVTANGVNVAGANGVTIIKDVSEGTNITVTVKGEGFTPKMATSIANLNWIISGREKIPTTDS